MVRSNKAMLFLSFIFILQFCQRVAAQRIREIIIDKDTVQEFNKNPSVIEETYVEDGIRLYTVDSLKRIISIATYKDNELHGYFYGFFNDLNMLEERGEYRANKKHGSWYYWIEREYYYEPNNGRMANLSQKKYTSRLNKQKLGIAGLLFI